MNEMSSLDSRISSSIQKLRIRWQIFKINCFLILLEMVSAWLPFLLLSLRMWSLFITISFSSISLLSLRWRVWVRLLNLMLSSLSLGRLRYLLNSDCFFFRKTHLSIIIIDKVGYAHRECQKSPSCYPHGFDVRPLGIIST